MADLMTKADFTPFVRRTFRIPEPKVDLTLVRIEACEEAGLPTTERTPFTLIFRGPKAAFVREGLHACDVEDGPRVELYIIPIHTADPAVQDYQAVFN